MGIKFVNHAVRHDDHEVVCEALRREAASRGMVAVPADAAHDVAYIVLPATNGWVTVYNHDALAMFGEVDGLGIRLSAALERYVVRLSVFDSDVCDARLYARGARTDWFDSWPGYDDEDPPSPQHLADVAGAPERWSEVLTRGTVDDLRRVFVPRANAETTMEALIHLLGCDDERSFEGYSTFVHGRERDANGAVRLHFRAMIRPAWEAGSGSAPAFELLHAPPSTKRVAVGDRVHLSLTATQIGTAGIGLMVTSWGDAIARGLVCVDSMRVTVGRPPNATRQEEAPTPVSAHDPRAIQSGLFEALDLPVGGSLQPGASLGAMMAFFDAAVQVSLMGRALAPGRGEIGLAAQPLQNEEGGVLVRTSIEIAPGR